jgi:hypothetical protein
MTNKIEGLFQYSSVSARPSSRPNQGNCPNSPDHLLRVGTRLRGGALFLEMTTYDLIVKIRFLEFQYNVRSELNTVYCSDQELC